jgi:hypothetical protein
MSLRNNLSIVAAAAALSFGVAAQAQTYVQPGPAVPAVNAQTGPQLDGSRADNIRASGVGQVVDQRTNMPAREDVVSGWGTPRASQTGPQLDGSRADAAKSTANGPVMDQKTPYASRDDRTAYGNTPPAKPGPQLDGLKTVQ